VGRESANYQKQERRTELPVGLAQQNVSLTYVKSGTSLLKESPPMTEGSRGDLKRQGTVREKRGRGEGKEGGKPMVHTIQV